MDSHCCSLPLWSKKLHVEDSVLPQRLSPRRWKTNQSEEAHQLYWKQLEPRTAFRYGCRSPRFRKTTETERIEAFGAEGERNLYAWQVQDQVPIRGHSLAVHVHDRGGICRHQYQNTHNASLVLNQERGSCWVASMGNSQYCSAFAKAWKPYHAPRRSQVNLQPHLKERKQWRKLNKKQKAYKG